MTFVQGIIAGIIQGLTEFLPVSSSGHLALYNALLGEEGSVDIAFTVLLHLATLLAVMLVYRLEVVSLVKEFFTAIGDIFTRKIRVKTTERRLLIMVVTASIPAIIAGIAVKLLKLDALMQNIYLVAVMFLLTAALMFAIDKMPKGRFNESNAPVTSAWIVGIIQACAVLPGLSRSGSTIFAGLLGRLEKEFAVKFAFLLSIPVILGATLIEAVAVLKEPAAFAALGGGDGIAAVVLGFAAAFATGLAAINLIKYLVKSSKFYIFGFYCLIISVVTFWAGMK